MVSILAHSQGDAKRKTQSICSVMKVPESSSYECTRMLRRLLQATDNRFFNANLLQGD